jgi:hypothetical protein
MILCVFLTPGANFKADVIEQKLRAANAWARFQGGNAWLIVTDRSPREWRDDLQPYVGAGSALVIRAARDWAGFTNEITQWLQKHGERF